MVIQVVHVRGEIVNHQYALECVSGARKCHVSIVNRKMRKREVSGQV